jgi:hypothetical protein
MKGKPHPPTAAHEHARADGDTVKLPIGKNQLEAGDDDAEFQADWAAAIAEGKIFAASEVDYKTRVTALIPKLAKLRKDTAQRRENYVKGSRKGRPKWGTLLKCFRAETGVTLCDKTIKTLIDEHEGIKPAPRPKKLRAPTITAAEARKIALALLAVHESLSQINEHGNVLLRPEDIAPILRIAPSPAELNRIVEGLSDEADTGNASGAAPDRDEVAETSVPNPSPKESSLPALKSGDVAGLMARLIERSFPDFEAVLGNLPPDAFADAIGTLADGFQKKFRRPGFGRIRTRTTYIPPKPLISPKLRSSPDPEQPSLFSMSAPDSRGGQEQIAS